MRDFCAIVIFGLAVAVGAAFIQSGVLLTLIMMSLYAALLAQAWNILGGYAGQLSFGHALFFGVGAYVQAMGQLSWGLNPWLVLPMTIVCGALVGLVTGGLTFRYGLRGSYFALVTLAFAEVFRIVAGSVSFTGGGVGLMVPLKEGVGNMQFASRHGYIYLILVFVLLALAVTAWLRHSRFGAYLQAVRDNEDAARAIGVDPLNVKLKAIAISAAFMSVAGAFYVQVFQYIDPSIAFGPSVSVEALVGAIVGGIGTLWGPIVGAVALHVLADLTRNLFGELPGISMVIYGMVLIVIVMFAPRGLSGYGQPVMRLFGRKGTQS